MTGANWFSLSEPRRRVALLMAALLSICALAYLGLAHIPLQVDGGWYSYPAVAWVLHGDPYAYQLTLGEAIAAGGTRVLFQFETTSSLRVLYTAPAIAAFGASRGLLLLVSLAEYGLLVWGAWLVFRATFRSRHLILPVVLLVAFDLSVLVPAVTDFRPDNVLAAASLLLYWLLAPAKLSRGRLAAATMVATLTVLTATTSPIPVVFIVTALGTEELIRAGQVRTKKLMAVLSVGAFAALVFLLKGSLFEVLLQPDRPIVSPVDPAVRMLAKWGAGPLGILSIEGERWMHYLSGGNLVIGLATMGAVGRTLLAIQTRRMSPQSWGTAVGLLCALIFVGVADAHETPSHLVPLVPFIWLLFSDVESTSVDWSRIALPALSVLAIAASIALSVKWGVEMNRSGSRVAHVRQALQSLGSAGMHPVVIGPTELWPYLPPKDHIVLVDWFRSADGISQHSEVLQRAQFVVLNRDYDWDSWSRNLAARPDLEVRPMDSHGAPLRMLRLATTLNRSMSLTAGPAR